MADGFHEIPAAAGSDEGKCRKPPQRDQVIEAVLAAGAIFWADPDRVPFVTIERNGRTERYKVRSAAFRQVVRAIYAERNPRQTDAGLMLPGSVGDKAMIEAVQQFEALANMPGAAIREPALRTIRAGASIWIDRGAEDWSLIEVTPTGWQVVKGADVPLIRADAMRALPMPDRKAAPGALDRLRKLLNLGADQDDDFKLIVCWLLSTLWPSGPYAILALDGEQGSGKSTASRLVRSLTDPNKAPLRSPPKKEDDLVVAANAGRVVALDNVSFIDADMADVLCRMATGAGLSKRRLYTDDEEHIVHVCRPVLLNGITSLMSRGDMADRCIVATLPRIPDDKRRLEADIEKDFAAAAPGILAALLDGMVASLAASLCIPMKETKRRDLPRMADFAALAMNAAPAFGWDPEHILAVIHRNRHAANIAVVESDPLSEAIGHVLDEHGAARPEGRRWEGTSSELLEKLNLCASEAVKRDRTWPKDGTRLSGRLRRLAPALRRCGTDVVLPDGGGRRGRVLTIQRSERSQRSMQENAREKRNANSDRSVPPAFPSVTDDAASVPPAFPSVTQRSALERPNILENIDTGLEAERWNAGNAVFSTLTPPHTLDDDEVEL
ncbi:MAG TPA: hypothetical protein PLX84_09140 [Acidiphilium sp.]|nr:hypothetical protein [Acidiphilium sp.]